MNGTGTAHTSPLVSSRPLVAKTPAPKAARKVNDSRFHPESTYLPSKPDLPKRGPQKSTSLVLVFWYIKSLNCA
jgi:hypothetical protein